MAIEIIARPLSGHLSGDPGASRVVTSHLALNEITEIRLFEAQSGVSGFRKIGSDLEISFPDGRSLHIGNFFVAGPDGQFSTIVSGDGAELVSGLLVPEPEALTFPPERSAVAPLPRADADPSPSMAFAAESSAAPQGVTGADPGNLPGSLGLAGGLASALGGGLGGLSLFSSGEGSDGPGSGKPSAKATPLSLEEQASGEASGEAPGEAAVNEDEELSDDEILQLLATDAEPEDTPDHAFGALVLAGGSERAAGGPLLLESTGIAPAPVSPLSFDQRHQDAPIESDL